MAPEHAKPVLLYASRDSMDQFPGVPEALARSGRRVLYERLWGEEIFRGGHAHPSLIRRMGAVIMADLRYNLHNRPVRLARRFGVPTVLLVDGVTEFSNIYLNPWLGEAHLRPAPEDAVLCLGELQRRILDAMGVTGNAAIVTGLPRLDGFAERVRIARGGLGRSELGRDERAILVATANFPSVTQSGLDRLAVSLAALRDACRSRGRRVRWRLTGDLGERLGVQRDPDPLPRSLARSAAVITTASTLAVEAMLCGLPTCILHPHPWPLWVPGLWEWRPEFARAAGLDGDDALVRSAIDASADARRKADRAIDELHEKSGTRTIDGGPLVNQAHEVIDALLSADSFEPRQRTLLSAVHTERATENVVAAIESALTTPVAKNCCPIERIGRIDVAGAERKTQARTRIVALIEDGGSGLDPIGHKAVELSRALLSDPRHDLHTLLIARAPTNFGDHHAPLDRPRGVSHTCVLDPADATHERIEQVVGAVQSLAPDLVLSLGRSESRTAAFQLKARGLPVLFPATDTDAMPAETAWLEAEPDTWIALAVEQGRFAGASDHCVRLDLPDEHDHLRFPDDPLDADRWVERSLQRAGFRRIALARPSDQCDAVLVRAADPRPTPRTIAAWRNQGLGVGVSPNLTVEPIVLLAQQLLARLRVEGRRRIAIFGAGERSLAFAPLLDAHPEIIGFIDDCAAPGTTHLGLPAATLDRAGELRPDCIITSTRHFDPILAMRTLDLDPHLRVASLTMSDPEFQDRIEALREARSRAASGRSVAVAGDPAITARYAGAIGPCRIMTADDIDEAVPRPDFLLIAATADERILAAARPWADAGTTVRSALVAARANEVQHPPREGRHVQPLIAPAPHGP